MTAVLSRLDFDSVPSPSAALARGKPPHIVMATETWPTEVNGVAMTVQRLVTWLVQQHQVTLIRVRHALI